MSQPCAYCTASAKLMCSACKSIQYCSKECQVNHWIQHQQECNNMKKRKLDNANQDPPKKKQKHSNINKLEPLHTIMPKLSKILDQIEQPTYTSTSFGCTRLPNIPELYVDGIGYIPLPICDQQIPLLLSKCNVVSKNKTKIYELRADKFRFDNRQWTNNINSVIRSVTSNLYVKESKYVSGKCNKLLIYNSELDGNVRNTEEKKQNENIFATLLIQLPSKFKTVNNKPVMRVGDERYYFGSDCRYNINCVAYYSDLKTAMNKIDTGIRLVVQYDLFWEGSMDNKPTGIRSFDHLTKDINDVIVKWDGKKVMAIDLQYDYDCGDGMDDLRGSDLPMVQSIIKADSQKELKLFLVNATRSIHATGYGGYVWDSEEGCVNDVDFDNVDRWSEGDADDNIRDEWYTLDGKEFMIGRYFELKLPTDCIGYKNDWDHINDEHDVDERPYRTSTYRKSMVVLLKYKQKFEKLINGKNGIAAAIEWIKVLQEDKCIKYDDILSKIKIVNGRFDAKMHSKSMDSMLIVLKKTRNSSLIAEFINDKLIQTRVGLTFDNNKRMHYNRYHQRRRIAGNVQNKECIRILANMLIEERAMRNLSVFGFIRTNSHIALPFVLSKICWRYYEDPIKPAIISLLSMVTSCDQHHIRTYCLFAKLISDHIQQTNDTYDLKQCLKEISNKLWHGMIASHPFTTLQVENIVAILNHMMSCRQFCDIDDQKQMFKLFLDKYQKINHKEKQKVIMQLGGYDGLVKEYGWEEPIKSLVLDAVSSFDIRHINMFYSLPQSIKSSLKTDKSEIECWKEIADAIWNGIVRQLKLGDENANYAHKMNNCHYNLIWYIFQFIQNCDWDIQKQKTMFDLFCDEYKFIDQSKQFKIIQMLGGFINVITIHGWKNPFKSMILSSISTFKINSLKVYLLLPTHIDSIINNGTVSINKEELHLCWKEIANAIWNRLDNMLKFTDGGVGLKKLRDSDIVGILKFMISFKRNKPKQMIELFDKAYGRYVKPSVQKLVIASIRKDNDTTQFSHQCIKNILTHRICYLTDVTATEPQFSWMMLKNGSVENKEFEAFLRSNRTQWTNHDFNRIGHAREWASSVSGFRWKNDKEYSVRATAEGGHLKSRVNVVKTRDYFNRKKEQYEKNVKELNELLLLIAN
eukprot:66627_1